MGYFTFLHLLTVLSGLSGLLYHYNIANQRRLTVKCKRIYSLLRDYIHELRGQNGMTALCSEERCGYVTKCRCMQLQPLKHKAHWQSLQCNHLTATASVALNHRKKDFNAVKKYPTQ